MTDLSILGNARTIWDEWRFEPWSDGTASGLYRRLSMIKGGLLGEVARYYADDYLVWRYGPEDQERLLACTMPQRDVMTHRFVLLQKEGPAVRKRRSIWLSSLINLVGSLRGRDERPLALAAGANVIMPNVTPTPVRRLYDIDPGKTGSDQPPQQSVAAIERMAAAMGRQVDYTRGDALRWNQTPGCEESRPATLSNANLAEARRN